MFIKVCELIGIILLLIVCFIQRHTFVKIYNPSRSEGRFVRIDFDVKTLLLFIVISLIPILNVLGFITYVLLWIDRRNQTPGDFTFSIKDLTKKK